MDSQTLIESINEGGVCVTRQLLFASELDICTFILVMQEHLPLERPNHALHNQHPCEETGHRGLMDAIQDRLYDARSDKRGVAYYFKVA